MCDCVVLVSNVLQRKLWRFPKSSESIVTPACAHLPNIHPRGKSKNDVPMTISANPDSIRCSPQEAQGTAIYQPIGKVRSLQDPASLNAGRGCAFFYRGYPDEVPLLCVCLRERGDSHWRPGVQVPLVGGPACGVLTAQLPVQVQVGG